MKKIFVLTIVITLIATLCSCKKNNNDVNSSSSGLDYSSEISNVTSKTEEFDASNTESDDTTSNTIASTPLDNTSSEAIVDNTSKEEPTNESSKEQTTEEKPKEQINFVPNKWPTVNSDLTFNYEDTYIRYQNDVFYEGVRYAYTSGKNNGVECWAIVTVGDNDEYLNCVSILDKDSDQRGAFNIYNDRIYYLQYPINDDRDYILLNTFSIGSMNLSGGDERIEKKVDLPYTHISYNNYCANSKYLYFTVSNLFDGVYDVIYRYNLETNELVNLNYKLDAHKTVYSIENRVFVWSLYDDAIYEYDIDFKNEKLFYETSAIVHLAKNGFILESSKTGTEHFLDLKGNIS